MCVVQLFLINLYLRKPYIYSFYLPVSSYSSKFKDQMMTMWRQDYVKRITGSPWETNKKLH